MAFYKASITKPQKLKRPLVLSFVGCDGGALRKENGESKGCYPTKDDIPLNISTHELITFIEDVSLNIVGTCT